jgi:ubiquinone/menaquinone biosynthesis C-methylase UbiE
VPRVRPPFARAWADDPPWATVYDWSVEHPLVGGLGWRVAVGSDLRLLYAAASEIGSLPAGSVVLDVPCGGGVALRGLRPGQGLTYLAADIAQAMLDRSVDAARRRGVADQVVPRLADVGNLPMDDGSVDLVVTFTGLHCFPDPRLAVAELARLLRSGGVVTGSMLATDTGPRYEPVRRAGRRARLLGPMCSRAELVAWFAEGGVPALRVTTSGAIAYFRGVKR